MSEASKPRWAEQIGGAAAGLGGIALAVTTATGQLEAALKSFLPDSWPIAQIALWIVVAALLVACVVLVARARSRWSILLRPEALRLDRNNPHHLVGRADDIERLAERCVTDPVTLLEGESGAGKSALVRAGLIPKLTEGGRVLPLVVSTWGQDWERGPTSELIQALVKALDAPGRTAVGIDAAADLESLGRALTACGAKLARLPLLIFDQFDDYQARHRDIFLPANRKQWLAARELKRRNGFWRTIDGLLQAGAVHALFVTRTDTAGGLASVQFLGPAEPYRLDRVATAFVTSLLEGLTSPAADGRPVVAHPERGWTQLRRRLAADLDADGSVLPQRLKIALAGLQTIGVKALTVPAYERAGQARGLEILFVEGRIASVAQTTQTAPETIRRLLVQLVDPDSPGKTRARSTRHLHEVMAGADATVALPDEAPAKPLHELEQAELVRRRVDPDTGRTIWLLDHDYLTNAVRGADARANRWAVELARAARAFEDAGRNLRRRWAALPGIATQFALLRERLRGRLSYRPHRRFALLSTLRLAPALAGLLAVGLVAIGAERWLAEQRLEQTVADIFKKLEFAPSGVHWEENAALNWLAAAADETVRRRTLEQILGHPDDARRFMDNPQPVLRALVGIDPDRRARYAREILAPMVATLETLQPAPRRWAATSVGCELAPYAPSTLTLLAEPTLGIQTLPEQLCIRALQDRRATSSERTAALAVLVPRIREEQDALKMLSLARVYAAVAAALDPAQSRAGEVVAAVLARMEKEQRPDRLSWLADAYLAAAAKLGPQEARQAAAALLPLMATAPGRDRLSSLPQAYGGVAGMLDREAAGEAVAGLGQLVERENDPARLWHLARSIRAAAAQLEPHEAGAQPVIAKLLARIATERDAAGLWWLADACAVVAPKLGPAEAREAFTTIRSLLVSEPNVDRRTSLVRCHASMAGQLDPGMAGAGAGVDVIVRLMAEEQDPARLAALAEAHAEIAWGLEPDRARAGEIVAAMLPLILKEPNPDRLSWLARAFEAAAAKLDPGAAEAAVELVFPLLARDQVPGVQWWLARVYATAALQLDQPAAERATSALLGLLAREQQDWARRSSLMVAYAAAAAGLDRPAAADAVGRLLRAKAELPDLQLNIAAWSRLIAKLPWSEAVLRTVELVQLPANGSDVVDAAIAGLAARPEAPATGMPESGLWAFAAWVESTFPAIDLGTAPPPIVEANAASRAGVPALSSRP